MSFKAFLKNQVTRREGGTELGNMLRGVVNTASNGILGNGLFMKKVGESPSQEKARFNKAAGEAIEAADHIQRSNSGDIEKAGERARIMRYAGYAIAAITIIPMLIILVVRLFNKKSKKR